MTDEEARALAVAAKSGGELVKAVGDLGPYVAAVVGSLPHNAVGLGGDWVDHARQRNQARLEARTAEILAGIARDRMTEPSPSIIQPLLDAARNESRETLQELWATLLANAMIDDGKRARRDFFDAVRRMEPADAIVLGIAAHSNAGGGKLSQAIHDGAAKLDLSANDIGVSIDALIKLGCFRRIEHSNHLSMTPFGRALFEACRAPT